MASLRPPTSLLFDRCALYISLLKACWRTTVMAQKDYVFKNVAVPEEDHRRLSMIAAREDRSMARQLAVMIREKFRDLELELAAQPHDAAAAAKSSGTKP